MADYAGAVAAIKQRMRDNWTTTEVRYQNQGPSDWEPAIDPNTGNASAWVYFEVIGSNSALRGAGTPGDHIWLYEGNIFAHVFVPVNTDDGITSLALEIAGAICEIFRAKAFYNDGQGAIVRTGVGSGGEGPRTDGGGSDADRPGWFRVTATIPFLFYYRG